MYKPLTIIFLLFITICPSFANQPKNRVYFEKDYQAYWCTVNHGQTEVILADKTRIDCLTQNYAVEMDFASKWAESIGQALYYGARTQKPPGIVLIIEDPKKDAKYLQRLQCVSKLYNITVWTVTPYQVAAWRRSLQK